MEDNNGPDDLEVHCRFFQTFVTAAFPPNKRHHGCLSSFYPLETTASESSGCPRLPDTSYLTPLSCHFIQMCIRLKECSAQWFTRPNIAVSFVLLMFLWPISQTCFTHAFGILDNRRNKVKEDMFRLKMSPCILALREKQQAWTHFFFYIQTSILARANLEFSCCRITLSSV